MAANRRSDWSDARRSILEAARKLFSRNGYRGTTTKELAEEAGVAEMTLFRHFPTKAGLFEEAAVEPIHRFLREWIDRWRGRPIGERDTFDEGVVFFEELMGLLGQEEQMLASLLTMIRGDSGSERISSTTTAMMSSLLDELEDVFAEESRQRGYRDNPRIAPRLIMAMAIGITVQKEWLFGAGEVPPERELVTEMARLTVWGLAGGRKDG